MLNKLTEKKGSAILLAGVMFAVVVFNFGLYVLEHKALLIQKEKIDDAVIGAQLAALGTADLESLSYGELVIPETNARNVFEVYLMENLGDIPAGPVEIEEFIVYNPGDYPTTCPEGNQITETSIHTVVTVPVERPVFKGVLGGTVDITIHRDSDSIFAD